MGVKVKVIEMLPEILGNMDKETSAMLRSEYKKKGVEFFLNTKVTEVSAEKVFVEKNGKADTIEADKILVSVGRRPIFPAGTYGLPGSGSCHTPYPRHTGRDEL